MPVHRSTLTRPLIAVAMVVASSFYAIAQQTSPSRVRGTIEAVDGDVLSVKSRSGEDVKLRNDRRHAGGGIARISLDDIKVGSFIGTTTAPGPDGDKKGRSACVSRRHARHRRGLAPFDLRPNSTMTNATVAQTWPQRRSNPDDQIQGRREEVAVSPDTPVVTYVPPTNPT